MRDAMSIILDEFAPPGFGKPAKTGDDYARLEATARQFRIEAEGKVAYWQKQEGRWRQARIKAQREADEAGA